MERRDLRKQESGKHHRAINKSSGCHLGEKRHYVHAHQNLSLFFLNSIFSPLWTVSIFPELQQGANRTCPSVSEKISWWQESSCDQPGVTLAATCCWLPWAGPYTRWAPYRVATQQAGDTEPYLWISFSSLLPPSSRLKSGLEPGPFWLLSPQPMLFHTKPHNCSSRSLKGQTPGPIMDTRGAAGCLASWKVNVPIYRELPKFFCSRR